MPHSVRLVAALFLWLAPLAGPVPPAAAQIEPIPAVGSIGGRLVHAETGAPLPGLEPPFAVAILERCNELGCAFVAFQNTDSLGRFHITERFDGGPLEPGTYLLTARASLFDERSVGPFAVGEGEDLDVGDVALSPIPLIGAIRGRLVDALNGAPLTGSGSVFTRVFLERCTEEFGCSFETDTSPDEQGQFVFLGSGPTVLKPGTYRLVGVADQYRTGFSEPFAVAEDEIFDIGDFGLQPLRVQFGAIHPCEIPPQGGICHYSAEIRHRGGERFDGAAWSVVEGSDLGSALGGTRFQTGRLGEVNPMPEKLNLKAGEITSLDFQVGIPGTVADGALFCFSVFIGEDPAPLFDTLTARILFCVSKQGETFVPLAVSEGRRRLQESRRMPP